MNDNRYILVIADDSPEMEIALEYACARSKKTSRKIIIATFIEPLDVLTTQGVTEIMKNEARELSDSLNGYLNIYKSLMVSSLKAIDYFKMIESNKNCNEDGCVI